MNKRQRITATNIVRHYLKKLGCHIESVKFVESYRYEYGCKESWDIEVNVIEEVKDIICNFKTYTVIYCCENRLNKKYKKKHKKISLFIKHINF